MYRPHQVIVVKPKGPCIGEGGFMTDGNGVATGTPMSEPSLIREISEDPVLANTKLIAEAWDCDGLVQVGAFPHFGGRWSEWNGKFRDVVRHFIKGTDGPWAGDFAAALCGSPNIYAKHEANEDDWWGNNGGRQWRGNRGPTASINFIIAHDGFTLADLVSYNEKQNMANGENNNDGEAHNLSWNCGAEGATDNWDVKRLRQRQMRNFTAALMLSAGVPMLHMGDEYGHSKGGNNNTYCHDSPVNYLDWDAASQDAVGLSRFTRCLIRLRREHPQLQRTVYVTDQEVQWHGVEPHKPDWSETSRLVAFTITHPEANGLYVAFNTSHKPLALSLPKWEGRVWCPLIDSSKVAPYDCLMADDTLSEAQVRTARAAQAMWVASGMQPVLPWSCVVLESLPADDTGINVLSAAATRAARLPLPWSWAARGHGDGCDWTAAVCRPPHPTLAFRARTWAGLACVVLLALCHACSSVQPSSSTGTDEKSHKHACQRAAGQGCAASHGYPPKQGHQ